MRLPWQRQKLITKPPSTILPVAKRNYITAPVIYESRTTGICMDYNTLSAPPVAPPCCSKPLTQVKKTLPSFESCMPRNPPVPSTSTSTTYVLKGPTAVIPRIEKTPIPPPTYVLKAPTAVEKTSSTYVKKKKELPKMPIPGSRAAKIQSFVDSHFK